MGEINHPQKIGIGTWEVTHDENDLRRMENLRFNWYYNWKTIPLWAPGTPTRLTPFIPMIWDETHVDEVVPQQEGILLGFNEPDLASQAGMSVDQAIALWPKLVATGLRLGSPATISNGVPAQSWLGQFMSRAHTLGYRVDFITVHYYSRTGSVADLKAYLIALHDTYHLPLWLTEWALVDWSVAGKFTAAQNAAFLSEALEMLDDLPFVERHAWFAIPSKGGAHSGLYDANGTLTVVGDVFWQILFVPRAPDNLRFK